MSDISNMKSTASAPTGYQGNANSTTTTNGTTGNVGMEVPLIAVQPPKTADLQPSYAKLISEDAETRNEHGWYGSMINTLGNLVGFAGAIPCCVCCPNPYKPVGQGNVGLITKFGRFYRAVDPGLVKINPLSERLIQVDVKIQLCEVPQQICMTKDNVTLQLTSVIFFHVISPHKAAFGISNVRTALIERTQTTLRQVVGSRVLQDVVERREEIAQSISEIIEEVAFGWGVKVESMLMKDIVFSKELQDSLSMAAQSKRIGESKVIAARAEVESAKLMRQAADILSSPAAMQIRYLESMQAMAKSANSKVIFLPSATTSVNPNASTSIADRYGEGPSSHAGQNTMTFGEDGLNQAYRSQVTENM